MTDFINNLRQMVDSEASDIIEEIKSLDFALEDNPNDFTIYSFKNIKDNTNLIINIMIFTEEGNPKESNNIFYDSSSSSFMKKDYNIMYKEVQRIRITYDGFINMNSADSLQDIDKYITDDGFINMNPADAILDLQDIDKHITELVSKIVECIIIYSSNINFNYTVEDEYKDGNKTGYKTITFIPIK